MLDDASYQRRYLTSMDNVLCCSGIWISILTRNDYEGYKNGLESSSTVRKANTSEGMIALRIKPKEPYKIVIF